MDKNLWGVLKDPPPGLNRVKTLEIKWVKEKAQKQLTNNQIDKWPANSLNKQTKKSNKQTNANNSVRSRRSLIAVGMSITESITSSMYIESMISLCSFKEDFCIVFSIMSTNILCEIRRWLVTKDKPLKFKDLWSSISFHIASQNTMVGSIFLCQSKL